MVCKNLCERLYSKVIVGMSHHEAVKNIVEGVKSFCITMACFVIAAGPIKLPTTPLDPTTHSCPTGFHRTSPGSTDCLTNNPQCPSGYEIVGDECVTPAPPPPAPAMTPSTQQGNCGSGDHMINGEPNICASDFFPYHDGTCPPGRIHIPGPDKHYCSIPPVLPGSTTGPGGGPDHCTGKSYNHNNASYENEEGE
jgi:hypothetical protein